MRTFEVSWRRVPAKCIISLASVDAKEIPKKHVLKKFNISRHMSSRLFVSSIFGSLKLMSLCWEDSSGSSTFSAHLASSKAM